MASLLLRREEVDRLGGRNRLDISRFEAEHPDTLDQLLFELQVAKLA